MLARHCCLEELQALGVKTEILSPRQPSVSAVWSNRK